MLLSDSIFSVRSKHKKRCCSTASPLSGPQVNHRKCIHLTVFIVFGSATVGQLPQFSMVPLKNAVAWQRFCPTILLVPLSLDERCWTTAFLAADPSTRNTVRRMHFRRLTCGPESRGCCRTTAFLVLGSDTENAVGQQDFQRLESETRNAVRQQRL